MTEFNFSEMEEKILEAWSKNKCFYNSHLLSKNRPKYTFFDGPPFATGHPHYGHILASTIKDTVGRFYYQQGFSIDRRFGWDCHGLPVEYEVDKKFNLDRDKILKMGIDKYNNLCRNIVSRYTSEWENVIERLGRWVSFEGYYTMDTKFMESVWYIFSLLFKKGLIYRGYKVMPYSTACCTPISNFEANQNYKEVSDPSIVVLFPIGDLNLMVWTTTPWTLVSNLGLLVDKNAEYAVVLCKGVKYVLIKDLVMEHFAFAEKDVTKKKQFGTISETIKGEQLLGLSYTPPFPFFNKTERAFFKIYHADFINKTSGTGIVHCAPGFGEDDYDCMVKNKVIKQNENVPCPIDEKGCYTEEVPLYRGRYVKDCDKDIVKNLKDRNLIFSYSHIVHRYPMCWRSDTPLLYRLVANWFINVSDSIDIMQKNNLEVKWIPEDIKYKKFHNWLATARDWSVSRNRFFGTPLPIWADEKMEDFICVGSIAELEELSGKNIFGNLIRKNGRETSETLYEQVKKENGDVNFEDDLSKETLSNVSIEKNEGLMDLDGKFSIDIDGSMEFVKNAKSFKEHLHPILHDYNKKDKYNITDIHREYVDSIVINKNGRTYKRVDDVMDCWFESGSMPYAQVHFPHGELNIPADFIGEGIDQTRGWFYTLHVISSLLFNTPAFKNVVVNGIVLAEDGRKMSKRHKNYPDVNEIINKYGSDCLRFFLLNSPVVCAENLRFNEDGVKDIKKLFLIPFYHVLNFYLDSKIKFVEIESMKNETMEGWILNRFGVTLNNIVFEMKEYKLNNIFKYCVEFIDDLRNWYVRMNRKKIKNENGYVLGDVLKKFCVVLAPFAPFFAEYAFQEILKKEINNCIFAIDNTFIDKIKNLRLDEIKQNTQSPCMINTGLEEKGLEEEQCDSFYSVHYCMYPKTRHVTSHPFDKVKNLIKVIRKVREENNITLKTVLSSVVVISTKDIANDIRLFEEQIKNECNFLKIIYQQETEFEFVYTCKPFFANITGTKEEKKVKINAINNFKHEDLLLLYKNRCIEKNGLSILIDEVLLKKDLNRCDGKYSEAKDFAILVDISLTDELKEMSMSREFNSFYQKMRKNAGLSYLDKRRIYLENSYLKRIIEKHYSFEYCDDLGICEGDGLFEYDNVKSFVKLFK